MEQNNHDSMSKNFKGRRGNKWTKVRKTYNPHFPLLSPFFLLRRVIWGTKHFLGPPKIKEDYNFVWFFFNANIVWSILVAGMALHLPLLI